jgi:C4-dicarboxylate-binding protein DctP
MWPSLVDERHAEVMKYFTDLRWGWDSQGIVINLELWKSLEPSLQEAIMKAAQEAEKMLYDIHEENQNGYISALRAQKDFTLTELTEEQRAVWRDKARMEAVWKELCDPWLEKAYPGENMGAKIREELANVRQKVQQKQ